MQKILVLLIVAAALSGCAGDTNVPFEPTADDDGSVDGSPVNETNTTAPPEANETVENLVPVFDLSVDVVNGTAPLLVNFTLDGEDDSSELSWAFYVEDNLTLEGSEFPTTFSHVFEAGVWNVTVTLTDGEHVVEETALVEVAVGDPNAGLPEPVTMSGDTGLPVSIDGICRTDYVYYGEEIWGWQYSIEPANHVPAWWDGDAEVTYGEAAGTVPANTDNVGACPDTAEEAKSWTITLWHPDYVLDA